MTTQISDYNHHWALITSTHPSNTRGWWPASWTILTICPSWLWRPAGCWRVKSLLIWEIFDDVCAVVAAAAAVLSRPPESGARKAVRSEEWGVSFCNNYRVTEPVLSQPTIITHHIPHPPSFGKPEIELLHSIYKHSRSLSLNLENEKIFFIIKKNMSSNNSAYFYFSIWKLIFVGFNYGKVEGNHLYLSFIFLCYKILCQIVKML